MPVATVLINTLIPFDRFSRFECLTRVTAWMRRFVHNCRSRHQEIDPKSGSLSSDELNTARLVWISLAQSQSFHDEIQCLENRKELPKSSCLRALRPFLDDGKLLRVGGRLHNSQFPYAQRHPLILCGKHCLTKLIIRDEHLRLLHAGQTLVMPRWDDVSTLLANALRSDQSFVHVFNADGRLPGLSLHPWVNYLHSALLQESSLRTWG